MRRHLLLLIEEGIVRTDGAYHPRLWINPEWAAGELPNDLPGEVPNDLPGELPGEPAACDARGLDASR